jgi:hypothetical protein
VRRRSIDATAGCGVAVTAAFVRALGQLVYFTLKGLDVAPRRGIVQQQTNLGEITAQRIDSRSLGTSARCRQLSSRLGLVGSRPPGRPTPAHCHGTPDFICRIRVLDRVQRSPNGRYEAGKRRSTVDGGPDPQVQFLPSG